MRIVLGSLQEELLAVSLIGRDHEVSQITCVCQLAEVDDVILRIFVHDW